MKIYQGFFLNNNISENHLKIKTIELLKSKACMNVHNEYLYNSIYVGQISNTFLVFSTDKHITIVDQHAAHEQIIYEKNIRMYEKLKEKNIFIQSKEQVLINLPCYQYYILKKHKKLINDLGFIISLKKRNKAVLTAYLPCYKNYSLSKFIKLFFKEYKSIFSYENMKINFLKAYCQLKACKTSLKSGTHITDIQAIKIRDDLNILANNSNCPHGRPLMYTIEIHELLKYFLRPNYSKGIKI